MRVVLQYIIDEMNARSFLLRGMRDEENSEHYARYMQGRIEGMEEAALMITKYIAIVDAVKKT